MQLEFKEGMEINLVFDNQRIKKKVGFVLPLDKWEGLVQEFLTDQYYPLADIWRCVGLFLKVDMGRREGHFSHSLGQRG